MTNSGRNIYPLTSHPTNIEGIVIRFHPLSILEIEYGYYDDTSRLLDRVTNWIMDC